MKKQNWMGMILACAMLAAGAAVAAEEVIFKSGDLAFTILKSDGVTPVEGAEVKVKASARSKALAESVTDKQGNVVLNLAAGQYVLNVVGRNISEMKVADDGVLSVCRVVLDDDKAGLVLAGGAAAAATTAGAAGAGAAIGAAAVGAGTLSTVVIGGVAVMVAAGGGYAVYDHNKDDDDKDEEPVVPPTPVRPSTRTRPSNR